mgnify:CR=1 FL=1
MKAYSDVKRKFMLDGKNGSIIVNIDDKVGESIFKKSTLPSEKKISFSIHKKSKIQATDISQNNNNLKLNFLYWGLFYQDNFQFIFILECLIFLLIILLSLLSKNLIILSKSEKLSYEKNNYKFNDLTAQ